MLIVIKNKTETDKKYTLLDNRFIKDYLPMSNENAVKVYLYSLYLIQCEESINSEAICENLSITETELFSSIEYWSDIGLFDIVSRNPLTYNILSLDEKIKSTKKYKKEKYEDFNRDLQELFPNRAILPSEFEQYYYLVETSHIEPEALLLIIGYCVKLKGTGIRYPYIMVVANEWINSGILSLEQVESKLAQIESISDNVKDIYKALKKSGVPDLEARNLYNKWTISWGYDHDAILFTASQIKSGSISKLDSTLNDYFKLGVLTIEDIQQYKEYKQLLFDTTRSIVNKLGLYYPSLDYITEIYIKNWIQYGYTKECLELIAHNCFIQGIKSLEGMKFEIDNFYADSIVDINSLNSYYAKIEEINSKLINILSELGAKRQVTKHDKQLYNIWTEQWGLSYDSIIAVCKWCKGKSQAMSYLGNILSQCKLNGKYTVSDIMTYLDTLNTKVESKNEKQQIISNKSKNEIDRFFDDIDGDII